MTWDWFSFWIGVSAGYFSAVLISWLVSATIVALRKCHEDEHDQSETRNGD